MTEIIPPRPTPIPIIPASEARHTTRAIRSGELTPLVRGMYASTTQWSTLAPWDRYLTRTHAAMQRDSSAVACLESAGAIWGLPTFGDPGVVHLLGDGAARSRVNGVIELHTTVDRREIDVVGGMLVTSVADTVVDLARIRHPALALAVADAALRLDSSLSVEILVARNEARSSSRGRRHARWALHRATERAESALESVDRAVIEWLGFEEPELQVSIGPDRVDKWWPLHLVAGEGDGDLKYDGRYGDASAALRRRHERDARLFRNGARSIQHWGWPEAIAADPLDALLTSAGIRRVNPRENRPLLSLSRALRGHR